MTLITDLFREGNIPGRLYRIYLALEPSEKIKASRIFEQGVARGGEYGHTLEDALNAVVEARE